MVTNHPIDLVMQYRTVGIYYESLNFAKFAILNALSKIKPAYIFGYLLCISYYGYNNQNRVHFF